MKSISLFVSTIMLTVFALAACTGDIVGKINPNLTPIPSSHRKTMRAFGSETELRAYLRRLAEKQKGEQRRGDGMPSQATVGGEAESKAAPAAKASTDKNESVTNTQHAGVDEGGIVKLHGNHLVILRRGRLFTVAIGDAAGDAALRPVSAVDAFGPDIDPRNTWYDEMLVSDETIAVIGYSYERGGTEVGLFRIDREGRLTYRSTHHLRSNDYYSSRNYASRLIGDKLIFYTPLYLNPNDSDPLRNFPAVRKWHKGANTDEFRRIVAATNVYRPERPIHSPYGLALHTVTVCDLSNGGFTCEVTGVIGPWGRVFYVSPTAVYVWVSESVRRGDKNASESMVYRMPLDGSAPSALGVSGSPVDQFSFLEDDDGNLNVLVRSDAVGDAMWGPETAQGDVALMRVSIERFSDGSDAAPPSSYHKLPKPEGYTFQNRFVGDYLLYGTGSGWGYAQKTNHPRVYAVGLKDGEPHELSLVHGVDRIEALGRDAVVVGTDGRDLHFTAIRLGESPEVRDSYTRKDASQGELRSHGFFYKADGEDSGVLGLPISAAGRPGYRHLIDGSASILFLHNSSLRFREAGELSARPQTAADDGCRASCVDWYGNARPLFIRGRVFALLGYEIVEGSFDRDRIRELRRINYTPGRRGNDRQG